MSYKAHEIKSMADQLRTLKSGKDFLHQGGPPPLPPGATDFYDQLVATIQADQFGPIRAAKMLESATPEVKAYVHGLVNAYNSAREEGGAVLPFAPRITTADVIESYGLDPRLAEKTHQQIFDAGLTAGLMERMGTDASLPIPEPTLADELSAAYDLHTEGGRHA